MVSQNVVLANKNSNENLMMKLRNGVREEFFFLTIVVAQLLFLRSPFSPLSSRALLLLPSAGYHRMGRLRGKKSWRCGGVPLGYVGRGGRRLQGCL